MIISIDDKTRIHGTEYCWQIERVKKVKGRVEWRPYKYYVSMDVALREAAQREIRTYPANGILEAIDACNRVTQKYAQIFDSVGKSREGSK